MSRASAVDLLEDLRRGGGVVVADDDHLVLRGRFSDEQIEKARAAKPDLLVLLRTGDAADPLAGPIVEHWVDLGAVRIESSKDSIRAVVYPTPAVPPDVVCVPLGQGRRHGSDYATDRPGTESSNVMDILETTQVKETGSLAWAGTRVRLSKTGDSVSISKLEGSVRAEEIGTTPSEEIIKTIKPENA